MIKIRKTTLIHLRRNNIARCPIYVHNEKYYIKANKPNTSSYAPFIYESEEYSEVKCIDFNTNKEFWYKI